jgi:predicted nucleotidyltransferase component of viral defense system
MIGQNEIIKKAKEWNIQPDIVDKDYVLGHFLSVLHHYYQDQLIFKGRTSLRKCWFPDYRFSEDLDFTALKKDFELTPNDLKEICRLVHQHIQISFVDEEIKMLEHENQKKGYQVKLKYWGANHSKNQMRLEQI